jgi:alpha-beta hydrolase superfamily lysophospholipase
MNKFKVLIIVLFLSNVSFGQGMFEYEKKIQNIENYNSIDLEFTNSKDKIKLYGTLVEPKSQYDKIVIIVPGTGMDTRNSHYMLTESLLKKNIAVFRYDERGVGKSEGDFNFANYTITDMANDLTVIFDSIKNNSSFSTKKIGLLGHSLGGLVTMSLVEKGIKPDFLIQWATPVQKNGEFLKYQLKTGMNKFENELIFDSLEKKIEVMTIFHNYFGGTSTENTWKEDLKISKEALKKAKEIGYTHKNYIRFYYCNLLSLKHIVKKDFENIYAKTEIPILYIIGTNDICVDQVAEVAKLQSFQNEKIKIVVLDGFNHYLTKEKQLKGPTYEIDNLAKDEIINWVINQ